MIKTTTNQTHGGGGILGKFVVMESGEIGLIIILFRRVEMEIEFFFWKIYG